MRVTHICRRFVRSSWGGTESAVLGLAQQLQACGHATEILASMALAESDAENISGIAVHRFPHFYPYLGLTPEARMQMDLRAGNLFSFQLCRHLLLTEPADVYHLHTGKRMGGIVRVAARHHGRPYVVSLHGGVVNVPQQERDRWTEPTARAWEWGRVLGAAVGARRVLDDAAAILCVDRNEQATLQARYPEKIVCWAPNSVDVQRYRQGDGAAFRRQHGIPRQARVVLKVARMDEQKNQLEAIEIFDRASTRKPDLWLLLAGASTNPDYTKRVQQRIHASANAARIRCLGNVDSGSQQLVDMYQSADVFLLTSVHEPFGIVLLEAWAAGIPIVAPRVGGIPSFVEHERNGLLFDSGATEQAVDCLLQVLTRGETRSRLCEAATQDVKRFDAASAAAKVVEIYQEVQHGRLVCA